ncbi:MAG: sulfatase-like hydrolase/transferase, partial [Novosphingobium sp.]|nr:sulfatase-like hydrolase/transferase [Novosphingobium sp.]
MAQPQSSAPPLPAWPETARPAKGAPNVLVVLTDDIGFSADSTFGGAIPTPTMDRLAANGLRSNQFHT